MINKNQILLLLSFLVIQQPVLSRRAGHLSGKYGQTVNNHGKTTQVSYKSLLQSKKTNALQTQRIEQYTKLGSQLEAKKNWADSEKAFRYVLQVTALRDGPGSFKSLPALEHLVKISKAQNKLDQAIDFQETAMLLRKAQPNSNQQELLNARLSLADLLMQKQDYKNAEPILKDSIDMYKNQTSLSSQKRQLTYQNYAKVLRQLHKDSEADAIDAESKSNNKT